MPDTQTQTIRYYAALAHGHNDLCTFAWFDSTPEALKQELQRLKGIFEKALATKAAKKFFDKKGYISNNFYAGRHQIDLKCGDVTAELPDDQDKPEDQWYGLGTDTPTPDEWDANIEDYAVRLTATGVYFIVESTYDEDQLDETPTLPYDLIP